MIRRARAPGCESDERLREIVGPDARFGSGGGDVGLYLPAGLESAHRLAEHMTADRFRFASWRYLDGPADGCARQEVSVKFYDSAGGRSWPVRFTFEDGRVIAADTWERVIVSGLVAATAD